MFLNKVANSIVSDIFHDFKVINKDRQSFIEIESNGDEALCFMGDSDDEELYKGIFFKF